MTRIWKVLLSLVLTFCSFHNLFASCDGDYMGVWPQSVQITQNPVFLIEYKETSYNLAEQLDEMEFFLLVNNKREVPVSIEQKVIGLSSSSQLLLKPKSLLKLNDSVQLQVRYKAKKRDLTEYFEMFKGGLSRKYKVTKKKDLQPTIWTDSLSWNHEIFNGFLSTRNIIFSYQVKDNNRAIYEYVPGKSFPQQLFEVELEGRKFYCLSGPENKFRIYNGECGWNYKLKPDKEYQAIITVLDFSGNRNPEPRKVIFNTFSPSKR